MISGCTNPTTCEENAKPDNPNLNVLILLDLSDRIIIQENQPARDIELINHICSELINVIINNSVDLSEDAIKISVAEQNNIPYSTLTFIDSLYFKMDQDILGGVPGIKKILKEKFPRNLENLYKEATYSSNPNDYSGANIARYFIRNLKYDIKGDSTTINRLFIFTDGYVVVGKEKNAMIDVHNKFPELEVMVLEIAPRNKDYESENLIKSWDNWFRQMGVKGYVLRNIGPIEAIKQDITRFMHGNLELTNSGINNHS
jgi:hypothetical protein